MEERILLQEEQKFSQISTKRTISVIAAVFFVLLVIAIFRKQFYGYDSQAWVLSPAFFMFLGLAYMIDQSVLITQVKEDGICVRWAPLHTRKLEYKWELIEQIYIRNYDGLNEFGGWGYKISLQGYCYTLRGSSVFSWY